MPIRVLIWLIVFFLPSQLGLHFWPSFSRVVGIRLDYLSPTLYFLDFLLFALIVSTFRSLVSFFKKNFHLILLLLIFIILNTGFSISPLNTFFWWFRLLFYLLAFLSFKLRRVTWPQIETPLFLSTLLVVSIAFFQTLRQSSLGGPFYWLGERAFTQQTPGLARLNLWGYDFVRAPSVFSHPNSFAGYLLVVLFLFLRYGRRSWYSLIPFFGIILSLSKNALLATFLLLLQTPPKTFILLSLLFSFAQFFLPLFPINLRSLTDRSFYYHYLPSILRPRFLFGTGYGSFIPALALVLPGSFLSYEKLQPIHNLYLLYFSEMGFLGLLPFFFVIQQKYLAFLKNHSELLSFLALILVIGSFDHFLWTLPQNKLITLLALTLLL